MAIFKGGKGRDDSFTGGTKADRFEFDPLDLNAADTIVGGDGRAIDVLRFTAPGAIGISALANVSGIERVELADGGANSLVLTDDFVASANGGRVTVVGGSGDDLVFATDLYDGSAIDFVSNGGIDYVFAGEGDDSFTFDIATLDGDDRVEGDKGVNTLVLTGTGTVRDAQLTGMEEIGAVAFGDGGVMLSIGDVLWATGQQRTLTVIGGAGADAIDTSTMTYAYQLFLSGGAGDDVITGGTSYVASVIDGGAGADQISAGNAAVIYDTADLAVAVGTGTLLLRGAATIDLTQDTDQSLGDNNVVTGFVGVDASASKQAVTLTGGAGDTLVGGAGRDTISGASTITGGGGADVLTGVAGTRFILRDGDFARGEVIRTSGGGLIQAYGVNDLRVGTVSGVTSISFGDFGAQSGHELTAFSSQLANLASVVGYGSRLTVIMDKAGVAMPLLKTDSFSFSSVAIDVVGTKGNDTIVGPYHDVRGGEGNDVIGTELSPTGFVDGGAGVDTLKLTINSNSGGSLDHPLVVNLDASRNQVTYNTFKATGFENVDLSGLPVWRAFDVTIRGDAGANVLVGANLANTIYGGAGDDTIEGGNTADRLIGGEGADRFVWRSPDGVDTVADFTSGEDKLSFVRTSADEYTIFDYNGGRFDTLVTADDRAVDLRRADLVVYTVGRLSAYDVQDWLRENGTAANDEGLFVVARDGANHTMLYYVDGGSDFRPVYTIADLGSVPLDQITLSDFAFI